MHTVALVLSDSRFPGGGHVHSGGLEEAAARGLVTDIPSLGLFLAGRLRTAGELAAIFAAAAVKHHDWSTLDEELDARTPSPAQRGASRAQGRATLRAGRGAWPSPVLDALVRATPRPHHAIVVGALTAIAGGSSADAALTAAYLSVSGPSSAAIRLLGLDPFAANAEVTRLSDAMRAVAERAVLAADLPPEDLPGPGAPGLDLLAEAHLRHHKEEVRLFAS
ncbi:urease accessory protein UreF [Kibdelosporangium phytohabitans]|uniref:Urease accessory protein UreF n=1 Tax=Kibdelosporangium phytohabitans TaxID=860235 RepID=A0A0N9HJ95_9PSEU|nr:urease accessory UreF family protein [Kibdelosporangium phytohabitans]ALG06074.1 urease accessory protein UreF [Kibdelosporangium phytohabitans]MBE1465843.1 urease accessory protein [Kibdelosporangium phytohabitans]